MLENTRQAPNKGGTGPGGGTKPGKKKEEIDTRLGNNKHQKKWATGLEATATFSLFWEQGQRNVAQ